MFDYIKVEGFRSFKRVELDVPPLSVLIGPNGSGKSNLLDLMSLMAEAGQGRLGEGIDSRGGFRGVALGFDLFNDILIEFRFRAKSLGFVGLRCINLRGRSQNSGRFATRYLDDQEVLGVFTLVDLQGFTQVVHQPNDKLEGRVQRVREWLRLQVSHARANRFFPHVCVHQTEAWILAEGYALAARLDDPGIEPDPSAEFKNFESPPSRRVNELFLRVKSRRYNKISDGRPLFAAMQFAPVYDSCRYFRAFYDNLRAMGRG